VKRPLPVLTVPAAGSALTVKHSNGQLVKPMFKLKKSRTFAWPVTVFTPDNGKHIKSTFTGHFRTLERDELQVEIESFRAPDLTPAEQGRRLAEFIEKVLVSVEGVVYEGDNGDAETDNRIICDALIADAMTAGAIFESYIEGINGRVRKN
jgi:hypothetical protein